MAWTPLEKLNYSNCHVVLTYYVKSISKRPTPSKDASIIQANLHIEDSAAYSRMGGRATSWYRYSKRKHLARCKVRGDWTWGGCMGTHIIVFVDQGKLFYRAKDRLQEFENNWLLQKILKKKVYDG